MKVRCDEPCHMGRKGEWLRVPPDYFVPNHAVAFWLRHGHIPRVYTYWCEGCKQSLTSGPAVAKAEGLDDFSYGQKDYYWVTQHIDEHEKIFLA